MVPIQPSFEAQDVMALDPFLHELFVVNQSSGYVEAVNSTTGTIDYSQIPAGVNPTAIAYDSADNSLYVAGANLTIVNPVTRQIVSPTIPLIAHNATSGIAFDSTRSYLYVTTYLGRPADLSTVSVIDGSSVSASSGSQVTIPVGELATSATPVSFAGSEAPAYSSIWVTNALSGTVSVIASPPTISFFSASPSSVDLGQTAQLLLGVAGGTGPDSISYSGLPSGCLSANAAELNCTPSETGNFTITVTVVDAFGYSASSTTILRVAPSLQVGTTFLPVPSPTMDVGVNLTMTAVTTGGTPAYVYQWTFGDGGSASGAAVVHSYSTAGSYLLSVTVTDSAFRTVTRSTVVTVVPDPTGTISVAPTNATDVGLVLGFSATAEGGTGVGNGSWNWGDGSNSTGLAASHDWNRSGNYTVLFQYVDAFGAGFEGSVNVKVAPELTGTFSSSAGSAGTTVGSSVTFRAIAVGGLAPYNVTWSFDDGSFGYGPKVVHRFATVGSYSVRVTLTDLAGASVNTTLTVRVAASSGGATSPNGGNAGPDEQLFLGLLAGFTVAAVALYAATRAKRRSPPPSSPYVPPEPPTAPK